MHRNTGRNREGQRYREDRERQEVYRQSDRTKKTRVRPRWKQPDRRRERYTQAVRQARQSGRHKEPIDRHSNIYEEINRYIIHTCIYIGIYTK